MGNYTLGEMIGKGGMGTVYRAHHEGLDIDVAVKFIHPYLVDDEEIVQRFLREARLSAKINHPNVRRTLDCGREEDGRPFIVMEYLEGESLREKIKRGPIPEAEALAIAKQILSGLAAAHAIDVVHRDIKPGNVFICRDGTVKLVDFGIAKALGGGSLTGTGGLVGTPEYMSPEQADGRPVDRRTDLYSLGIVLYEMLTAQVPFTGDTPVGTLYKHVHQPPPALPNAVSPSTRDLTSRLLAKAPADRYVDAQDAPPSATATTVPLPPSALGQVGTHAAGPSGEPPAMPSGVVANATSGASPRRSATLAVVIAVVVLALFGGGAIIVATVENQAQAERARERADEDRRAAEAETARASEERRVAAEAAAKAEQERKAAEAARLAQELERKRANPLTIVAHGVTLREPKVDKWTSYEKLGRPRKKFYVFVQFKNNLYDVEDQSFRIQIVLFPPQGPESVGKDQAWTIDKSEEQDVYWNYWTNPAGFADGEYRYSIRVDGKEVAQGSVTVP